jgi:NitT/TauT family transport system substrate-binding protein
MIRSRRWLALAAVVGMLAAACGTSGGGGGNLTAVKVQLQWVSQAQFAGEIAALKEGYYKAEGLDVTLLEGGPNVANITVGCAKTGPEFTLGWVPKALVALGPDCDLVSIAQIFQRSGTRSVSWKDSNITKPSDFKGKKVGVWDFGNEYEVTAGAKKDGNLVAGTDYTKVIQAFDMSALLKKDIDVAEAMTYNEYAQVLEAKNPVTGKLYTADDLNVIDWNQVGTAMLQDAVFARKAWLSQSGSEDVAVKFLKATFKGWIFCRDNQAKCVDYVLAAGTTLGKGHQTWQMNEVNKLIWPSPNGIGITDKALWDQTIQISLDGGFLKAAPPDGSYRNDLAQKALDQLGSSVDTKGANFTPATVQVTEGGN